jgi:hypothetical protein
MYTSEALLTNVIGVLTRVPKKVLKNYFVRHCSTNQEDLKSVQADWKQFSAAYTQFRSSFAKTVGDDDFLQRVFVQLATTSALMGKLDADEDEYGLYAGCALFVSKWCEALGQVFFPGCNEVAFFALWSPFLDSVGIKWPFHGTPSVVTIALQDLAEDGGAFPLVFPGPCPKMGEELGVVNWSKVLGEATTGVFGAAKISSRQVLFFNPTDADVKTHRKHDAVWAIDSLPVSKEAEEFEEESEEDEGEYQEQMNKLQEVLGE